VPVNLNCLWGFIDHNVVSVTTEDIFDRQNSEWNLTDLNVGSSVSQGAQTLYRAGTVMSEPLDSNVSVDNQRVF
jgi:hypothetical protein